MCCELGDIIESLDVYKKEKTPHGKILIAKFIENAIRLTYIDSLEDLIDQIAPIAVGISDEKDANLRD